MSFATRAGWYPHGNLAGGFALRVDRHMPLFEFAENEKYYLEEILFVFKRRASDLLGLPNLALSVMRKCLERCLQL